MNKFYSNGKLLLTAEYVILDGAKALALPTTYGQSLSVEPIDKPKLIWKSLDKNGNIWFESEFGLTNNEILKQVQQDSVSKRLIAILNTAKQLNPDFLNSENGFKVETRLDFARDWGLGTSSTLINNIAKWAQVDAYVLLDKAFGGSGYDIACAQHNIPIIYHLNSDILNQVQDEKRIVREVHFYPKFSDSLYFVYLNKKQNSRKSISEYNALKDISSQIISEISDITLKMIDCKNLKEFEILINQHEHIISKIIKQKAIKDLLFKDFQGSIKSLGAWGGDFILVTSKENPASYFESKGFKTIIPYKDMVLQ